MPDASDQEYIEYVTARLPAPRRLAYVTSFSDDGRVLGGKLESDDQVRPVRWTCR
ncbi:hypothetical protein AB0F68_18125 [Micromonospora sp. NPDC023966]|uniref:hypothetical protein n=1 Tax=Micromonospora sp. NPDC023966 TaxID=3154699 RepID=UPI0033E26FA4